MLSCDENCIHIFPAIFRATCGWRNSLNNCTSSLYIFFFFLFVSLLFNSKISNGHFIYTSIYILCAMLHSDLNCSGKCDESASVGTIDGQKCIHNNSGQAQQLVKRIEKWHAALSLLALTLTLALWLSVASCLNFQVYHKST